MGTNFTLFERFAARKLEQSVFKTDPDSEKYNLFHTSLSSSVELFQWTQNATNVSGAKFRFAAGYIDRYTPNALADFHEGTHFIAMHSALFVAISEFTMFCFTQRDFFPDVGDPSQERSPMPWNNHAPGIWLIDHTKKGGTVNDKHSQKLIPKNTPRYHMSIYLAFLMSRFVWLHELTHCFNGHVAYVHHHRMALRLYEISAELTAAEVDKTGANPTNSKNLKCLEFDADESAFWASCNIQLNDLENIEGIQQLDQDLRLRLTLFGCYAMIWLFEQFQNYLETKDGCSHPEPMHRLYNLLQTARTNVLPLRTDLSSINETALQQFDIIRERVPNIFESRNLLNFASNSPEITALSNFEEARQKQKKALKQFQYSEKQ